MICRGRHHHFLFVLTVIIIVLLLLVVLYSSRIDVVPTSSISLKFHRGSPNSRVHPRRPPTTTTGLITVRSVGRLGNMMFQYASLLGIAQRNNLQPVLPSNHYLRAVFNITVPSYRPRDVHTWVKVDEVAAGSYDNRTENLAVLAADMVELTGYLQSWKYFDKIDGRIRQEFAFSKETVAAAEEFITRAVESELPGWISPRDVVVVGVHIRRGDLDSDSALEQGYKMADMDYIQNAMHRAEVRYASSPLIFIICTDDVAWVRRHRPHVSHPVVVSAHNDDDVDLAILSLCDVVIMTVGTYGWWAAYLAGPATDVYYYTHYAAPDSHLARQVNNHDHFPPYWVGL